MTLFLVLKGVGFTSEDGSSAMSAMPGATIEIGDNDFAQGLVDAGRIKPVDDDITDLPTGTVVDGEVNLVEEVPADGKPSESATNAELVDFLVKHGVKRATVEHLKKADLQDAIDRLTHTDDDD